MLEKVSTVVANNQTWAPEEHGLLSAFLLKEAVSVNQGEKIVSTQQHMLFRGLCLYPLNKDEDIWLL